MSMKPDIRKADRVGDAVTLRTTLAKQPYTWSKQRNGSVAFASQIKLPCSVSPIPQANASHQVVSSGPENTPSIRSIGEPSPMASVDTLVNKDTAVHATAPVTGGASLLTDGLGARQENGMQLQQDFPTTPSLVPATATDAKFATHYPSNEQSVIRTAALPCNRIERQSAVIPVKPKGPGFASSVAPLKWRLEEAKGMFAQSRNSGWDGGKEDDLETAGYPRKGKKRRKKGGILPKAAVDDVGGGAVVPAAWPGPQIKCVAKHGI